MNTKVHGGFYRLIIPLLILLLACSLSPSIPLTGGNGYRFDGLSGKAQEGSAISNYQAISKWANTNITYSFINGTDQLPGDTEQDVIKQAFALWAAQAPLTFTQVNDHSQANIVIGWATGDHGDGEPFDGPGDVLAHSSFPNPYDDRQVFLHFDEAENWVDSTTSDVDLETVAAHEIGHTLGLDHSDDPNALMYPSYEGPHRSLGADDIAAIQSLYGLTSNPAPAPEVPGNQAPPASNGQDTDQDELFVTGTDANNPDSDGDGIEVQNRMNPLDPDMDQDGVSDGQEVARGSDPLLLEQASNWFIISVQFYAAPGFCTQLVHYTRLCQGMDCVSILHRADRFIIPFMNKLISIVGVSGVGKTALVDALNKTGLFATAYEQHIERPFQALFKQDRSYALHNQVDYFLLRAEQERELRFASTPKIGLMDGGLDLDFHGFSRLFHQRGLLTDAEYDLCGRTYTFIRGALPFPDLIVHLCADENTVVDRLSKRDRINIVSAEDTALFNSYLTEWLSQLSSSQLLELDVSHEAIQYIDSVEVVIKHLHSRF